MKKKIVIIGITVVVFVILVFPIKVQYKEGGTIMYNSLTYKIIVWNALMGENEIKTGTEVHLFPNNFHDYAYYLERSK